MNSGPFEAQEKSLLEIRRAGREDAEAISEVLYESFREFEPLYTEHGFAATVLGAEQVVVRIQQGPVWVALCERSVIGTVAAYVEHESVYIRGMAVLPSARRLGAGSKLLQEPENWGASERCSRILLKTAPFLDSAIRLYERCGFRRTRGGLHDLFGTPLFAMEKALGAASVRDFPVG